MIEEMNKIIDSRVAELEKDYQRILATIDKLDQDKSDLITRGVQVRGGIAELKKIRKEFNDNNVEATPAVQVSTQEVNSSEEKPVQNETNNVNQ